MDRKKSISVITVDLIPEQGANIEALKELAENC
jgi:hypothetical protein